MADGRDPRERLAVLVADGQPVDWDEAVRSASDERERRVIRHLRLVESVARVHRGDSVERSAPGGTTWAHLELRQKLGEGAFGEVYRAWDRRLEREVALKLLKSGAAQSRRVASLVVEEGRVLAKLRHPNVVTVHGAEVYEGRVGLWMEFIRGRSLAQVVEDHGPMGAREAEVVGIELCRALAAVHGAGVVHRDVKAQNVMRESGGRIVLMDFGAGFEPGHDRSAGGRSISGTPFYMAPEVMRGAAATQASDLYSLGVLLYHLVTGSFPVEAGSWSELLGKHERREVQLLRDRRPDLPEPFVKVVERALAHDPRDRFATAGQMEQALAIAVGVESGPAAVAQAATRRPGPKALLVYGLAGLAIVATAVVGALLLVPERPAAPAAAPVAASYTVEAALFRVGAESSARERLEDGARLALGDRLTLELTASRPLHVYVINEDEAGHAFALFPLPGLEPSNPVAAGVPHVLPGMRDGVAQSWIVDSPGGREHLLVLASPTRLVEFEADMNALARPGQAAVALPEATRMRVRGIGGLAAAPAAQPTAPAGRLFEMAEKLASRAEVVEGVWFRRIDLENPRPE